MSDQNKIFNYLMRQEELPLGNFSFDELLYQAINKSLHKSGQDLESYYDSNCKRLWNSVKKKQQILFEEKGITPIFDVRDDAQRIVCSHINNKMSETGDKKYYYLKSRPYIFNEIESLNARQYEALSVLVCELLSANHTCLTPQGNEAGIDFIATIKFSELSHYLLGINGPVRIIGQCKKYSSPVQVDKIKEFNSTMADVYHLTSKMRSLIPSWFLNSKGPIIGWIISHSGFQSGAIDRGKNNGYVLSDSFDLAEILAKSKKFHPCIPTNMRHKKIIESINEILKRI